MAHVHDNLFLHSIQPRTGIDYAGLYVYVHACSVLYHVVYSLCFVFVITLKGQFKLKLFSQ